MTLLQPLLLLLIIPLVVALKAHPLPSRELQLLRAILLGLLVVALAEPVIRLPREAGTIIVVTDHSASMPAKARMEFPETIRLLQDKMKRRQNLAVISFGEQAIVEQLPQTGRFEGFSGQTGMHHSNLHGALDTALSLIPEEESGRILLLSDGRWTGIDPARLAGRAASRNVAVDFRATERPDRADVAIRDITAPQEVQRDEAFIISAWIESSRAQPAAYSLYAGKNRIAAGTTDLIPGTNRLLFRDRADRNEGVLSYRLEVTPQADDPLPENNTARLLVGVRGVKPIGLATANPASGLADLLNRGGMDLRLIDAQAGNWSLEMLAGYSGILLENLPSSRIGLSGMHTLKDWVEYAGGGLMFTGGPQSYGPGGYYQSPLEAIMPLSMELRKEHRKLSLSIVVALDRSGSMTASAGGGKTKMDLANLGTVEVFDLLSPMDELGVLAVDSAPHEILPLSLRSTLDNQRQKILSIESMGGGIYVFEALKAASQMQLAAKAGTRHIILFADAADAEQPGDYKNLLQTLREADITVSVIGLGSPSDVDAQFLRDVAKRGGGTCYFSTNAHDIPRLFAQDTFAVARSSFVEEATPFKFTGGFASISPEALPEPPALGGYNLCYLRPGATLGSVTTDEYQAPVVAAWQAGHGRVLCYTGQADGEFSGAMAAWPRVGSFYSSLAQWTAGERDPAQQDFLLEQQVQDGQLILNMHLDPERKSEPFSATPSLGILRGNPGEDPTHEEHVLQWADADRLSISTPLSGSETVLASLQLPGEPVISLPPVCLPYSQEYRPPEPGKGRDTLERLARLTGGKERVHLAGIWDDLPKQPVSLPLAPWLYVLAALLFLLEIAQRRTGLLLRNRVLKVTQETKETQTTRRVTLPRDRATTESGTPTKSPESTARGNPFAEAAKKAQARNQRKKL